MMRLLWKKSIIASASIVAEWLSAQNTTEKCYVNDVCKRKEAKKMMI